MPQIISKSMEDTVEAGKNFAETLKCGDIIGLKGNLGSGKTQFVKGICKYFNVNESVNSPTFVIVNEYSGNFPDGGDIKINHFDLYRLKNESDLETIGIESYFNENSICLIEWSEMAEKYLNSQFRTVYLDYGPGEDERKIIYKAS